MRVPTSMHIKLTLITIFTLIIHFGYPLVCYKCSGSSRNADKADDKACVNGYSTIRTETCPSPLSDGDNYVCSTYQYEISIYGLARSSVTMRGCQSISNLDDCDDLLDDLKELVYPARVKQLECFSCGSNLCNSK